MKNQNSLTNWQLYFLTKNKNRQKHCLQYRFGNKAAEFKLGAILSTSSADNRIIYFGDANGQVYAYKLK